MVRRQRGRFRVLVAVTVLAIVAANTYAGAMQQSGAPANADLVVIGRVIGMVDTSPAAASRKTRELHSVLVERTIQGADETGLRLLVRPNGERWVDGESYLLSLRRQDLRVLEVIPRSSLPAGSAAARAALDEIARSKPVVTPQRVLWVRHETGSTGQVRMEFWMAADGAFEYHRLPVERGAAPTSPAALTGRLPAAEAATLIKRVRSTGGGPAADDAGIATFRLVGPDKVPDFRVFTMPDSPPAAEVLREISELARKYGDATGSQGRQI